MLAVKYFMWSYQAYFQVSAQVASETLFQRLDPRFEPHVYLVGFLAQTRPGRHPICVVPDDCPYQPEQLGDVLPLTSELEHQNEAAFGSSTKTAEKQRDF